MRRAPVTRQVQHTENPEVFYDRNSGTKPALYEMVEVPEELGPMRVVVNDQMIKQFAFCQDDYHRWHFERSPFGPRIAHAALLGNDLLNVYYSKYDRHTVMGVHAEEELTFLKPVPVGETVVIAGRYTDKYERRGQGYVVMRAEAADSAGDIVARHRGVEIMHTKPGGLVGRGSALKADRSPRIEVLAPDWSGPVVEHVDTVSCGSGRLAPLVKTPTQAQVSVFSYVDEYQRNIHNDLGCAHAGGLERPIAQGMQSAGYYAEYGTRFFGAEWFTGGWLRTKFLRPVYAGDTLRLDGRIAGQEVIETGRRVSLEMWCRRDGGEVTSVAWMSCTLSADRPVDIGSSEKSIL